jgi:MFS family permease
MGSGSDGGLDRTAVQRRVLRVLVGTQVLGGVGVSIGLAVSTLAAARMSGSDAVGGSALTCAVLGAAGAAVLIARIATRSGRRPSLTTGYLIATGGGAVAVVAAELAWWPLLLAGLVLLGAGTAAGLAARFTATDLADPERRARALARVVWATTVGAVAGPNLGEPAQRAATAIGLAPLAGPFLGCALVFAVAALLTWLGLRPDPLLLAARSAVGGATAGTGTSTRTPGGARVALRTAPGGRLGLAGIVLCHMVMVGLMSMTPVHMGHGGATLQLVGLVISVHVAGMYALSPVFGWSTDRIGARAVLGVGAVLLAAAGVVCSLASGHQTGLLGLGLVLLGLGWSAGLVAGSTLVSTAVPVPDRPAVQSLADVSMNVAGAAGGIVAGLTVAGASFAVLGVGAALLTVPYLVVLLRARIRPVTATGAAS